MSTTRKENIPLIHNYCDQWCERCAYTSRCGVFRTEQEEKMTGDPGGARNQAFWDRLSQNMVKARTLLEEAARKSGIDLKALDFDFNDYEKTEEKLREESDNHPAARLAKEYDNQTRDWLKTQPGMLDKLENLKKDLTMGVETQEQAKEHVVTIKDSLAIIEWYSTFIYVKSLRALMSKGNDVFEEDESQSDSNGSAKIALIGIERSMQAWLNIFNILPEEEDHFLNILSLLEQIKNHLLKEFPHAMSFIRPGFDQSTD
jgi:hypothetical protein